MDEDKEKIDEVLLRYLNVLDSWQREVDDVRQMHHVIWERTQPDNPILQHRTGSRVEKQTRIGRRSQNTNIDWMFEVSGVRVQCNDQNNENMYLNWSETSPLFGTVVVTTQVKNDLLVSCPGVFDENVFSSSTINNKMDGTCNFFLKPVEFRDRVMSCSGFEYKPSSKSTISKTSASLPGRGVVNAYDPVPCLRLAEWPNSLTTWSQKDSTLLTKKWKQRMKDEDVPIFIVPAGDPISPNAAQEYRLSFSMLEIKMFSQFNRKVRVLLGVVKFVFQDLFASVDLLSWFHVKHMVINFLEELTLQEIDDFPLLDFVFKVLSKIMFSIKSKHIKHLFFDSCNLFPFHKLTKETMQQYQLLNESIETNVMELLRTHIATDLKVSKCEWYDGCISRLSEYEEDNRFVGEYVDGYLTRLLSVTTLPLYRDGVDRLEAVERIRVTFERFKHNKHIARLIPIVNESVQSVLGNVDHNIISEQDTLQSNADALAISAASLFEKMLRSQPLMEPKIQGIEDMVQSQILGISVTKYHKDLLSVDKQIQHVIASLEMLYGTCPRFYLHPALLVKHLQILYFLDNNTSLNEPYYKLFTEFVDVVKDMSSVAPYYGKLSYRLIGMFLLRGHLESASSNFNFAMTIPFDIDEEIQQLIAMKDAGNFDLK